VGLIIIITAGYVLFVWLAFFKFKWLKFSPVWAIVSGFIGLHILLGLLIGLRFATPQSSDAKVVQYTIQLIPRLPEPTLVTAVLAQQNVYVKKGQPLFQFDRRPYQYQVSQLEGQLAADSAKVTTSRFAVKQLQSQLAAAEQQVGVLKADLDAARQRVLRWRAELKYAQYEQDVSARLAQTGAGPSEDVQKWAAQVSADKAEIEAAQAGVERASLEYESQIGGVNTVVASAQAALEQGKANQTAATASVKAVQGQLALARYYLSNTTMVAPADGHMINVQVRPGMVSGIVRVGGIATFVVDADRYLLGSFNQEVLKFVKIGQPVEVALDLYPGQIFKAKVGSIWYANGQGQYLPSDVIPIFYPSNPNLPQGQFAVQIFMDEPSKDDPAPAGFPIGAQGIAAIYCQSSGPWAALRRIDIRTRTWLNWVYPAPF
jgi:multidrug resistance efflux pump